MHLKLAHLGITIALGASLACTLPASANPLKSLYTTIDHTECQKTGSPSGTAWLCQGLEGYPVYISESKSRTYVSVGQEPQKRRAASQSLAAPNSLFRVKSTRATLEWRFVKKEGKIQPYATIQRYFTKGEGRAGEVLVVTKVSATEDCHVAHIDALATPQAIALARRIADDEARAFDCSADPKRVGKAGRSPM